MSMKYLRKDAVLCYVDECRAWFTTQKLKDQWGDDWNDAPYEHNAGDPYEYKPGIDKSEPWKIFIIYWNGDFLLPNHGVINSTFSVEGINGGAISWLRAGKTDKPFRDIPAGTNMIDFAWRISLGGGEVYVPISGFLYPVETVAIK